MREVLSLRIDREGKGAGGDPDFATAGSSSLGDELKAIGGRLNRRPESWEPASRFHRLSLCLCPGCRGRVEGLNPLLLSAFFRFELGLFSSCIQYCRGTWLVLEGNFGSELKGVIGSSFW